MQWLMEHLQRDGGQIDLAQAIFTLVFATFYSYIIAFAYARTYSGTDFSRQFAH